jgi:hypothetical protein
MSSRQASRFLPGALVMVALLIASPLAADEAGQRASLTPATTHVGGLMSVASGIFRPSEQAVRDIYGGTGIPLNVQFEYRTTRRLGLFGGVRWGWNRGTTVAVGSSAAPEGHALRLRTTSIRGGVLVARSVGQWDVSVGVGASYTTYEERWQDAPITANGHELGALLQGAVQRSLTRRFLVIGRIEYSSIPNVERVVDLETRTKMNLGYVEATAGLGFRF